MDSSRTRDQTHVPCIATWILIHSVIGSPGYRLPMLVIIFFLHIDCVILLPIDFSCCCCLNNVIAAATAKSRQLCPTPCNPIGGSPPGSSVLGILQAGILEWAAISFSNASKWKVKVKSLSHVWLFTTPWTVAHQAPPSMGFPRQEYQSGLPLPSPSCWHRLVV